MKGIAASTALGLGLLGAPAQAAPSSLLHLDIPGRGGVALAIPDGWAQSRRPAAPGEPPTLRFVQRSGPAFDVRVTVIGVGDAASTSPDPARIRAFVAAAARSAGSQSVERTLAVRELAGAKGVGFYFVATDRAPAPGEWKCLTQGAIGVGRATVAFAILTNDSQKAITAAALEMLRRATFEGPAVST